METRQVVVVAYDGAELLDIACITSTFEAANRISGAKAYDIALVSPGGRPVRCDSGLELRATGSLQKTTGPIDTLVISGGLGHVDAGASRVVTSHVRRLADVSRRVNSVCTGATVLAAAGLLDGRRVTTHWHYADELARNYPSVTVDAAPIFIRDGKFATAAGVTSGLDLCLALVEEDLGPAVARLTARAMVTYLQRPGNQAQMSMFVDTDPPEHELIRQAVNHVAAHLDADLDAAGLARKVGVSERQLSRLFVEHLGMPPGRYVRRARLEAAARLLTDSDLPVAAVAHRCGFGSAEVLRQAFSRQYGVAPARYRAAG